MSPRAVALVATLTIGLAVAFTAAGASLSPAERALVLGHAGWPPVWSGDDSNRVSGNRLAQALGARLFFDKRLSSDATFACASCHLPERWFTDGLPRGQGRTRLDRNTPTIVDARWHRWFGWGGAHDSLWNQAVRALTAPDEMAGTEASISSYVRARPELVCGIEAAFNVKLDRTADSELLVMVAKTIAAYQELLVSGPSPFDRFVAAVKAGDRTEMSAYPNDALAGFKIFSGVGKCNFCHLGPRFTNDEFADVAVPYFTEHGVDKGRYTGIRTLKASPYTVLGEFSDAPDSRAGVFTRFVALKPRNFGEFKVPSLRNVARTAPYMHDGSLASLADVVAHYSDLNIERLHSTTSQLLRPLRLSTDEQRQLVAFLETLTSERTPLPQLESALADACAKDQ